MDRSNIEKISKFADNVHVFTMQANGFRFVESLNINKEIPEISRDTIDGIIDHQNMSNFP
jgi:hypothetical protein